MSQKKPNPIDGQKGKQQQQKNKMEDWVLRSYKFSLIVN
jgi:hypothetical protein